MKLFRNSNDYWHFFGAIILPFVAWFLMTHPEFAKAFLVAVVILSPWLWEKWDQYKVMYDDPRAIDWGKLTRMVFTSEGKFDKVDLMLGYAGMFIGFIILTFLLYFV